ncbi:unnamed protein product [Timema podura]|uniref:Uncharacterized protein n=1 Tax=Timema podura TaxID=61482 RepID=A0ABN7NQH9_TIMPD|nr:unnamed protein product [Timema podura]
MAASRSIRIDCGLTPLGLALNILNISAACPAHRILRDLTILTMACVINKESFLALVTDKI